MHTHATAGRWTLRVNKSLISESVSLGVNQNLRTCHRSQPQPQGEAGLQATASEGRHAHAHAHARESTSTRASARRRRGGCWAGKTGGCVIFLGPQALRSSQDPFWYVSPALSMLRPSESDGQGGGGKGSASTSTSVVRSATLSLSLDLTGGREPLRLRLSSEF